MGWDDRVGAGGWAKGDAKFEIRNSNDESSSKFECLKGGLGRASGVAMVFSADLSGTKGNSAQQFG